MNKKIAIGVVSFLVSIAIFSSVKPRPQQFPVQTPNLEKRIHEMPIVEEQNPLLARITNGVPVGHREREYAKWLQSSFKINNNTGEGGSGTLCYYDSKSNIGYIISCGHLWKGTAHVNQINEWVQITTWYQNTTKLTAPRTYPAKVIFYSNNAGYDCSLLAFKPDWIPNVYYPIGVRQVNVGERLHSVGCDHASEVADYIVEIVDLGNDPRGGRAVVTQYNSPRPGRSGGGLMDGKGYFLGICWGTSKEDGTGLGYFTPLTAIQTVFANEGYTFLLKQPLPGLARRLPIFDHLNPNKRYDESYIILPNN